MLNKKIDKKVCFLGNVLNSGKSLECCKYLFYIILYVCLLVYFFLYFCAVELLSYFYICIYERLFFTSIFAFIFAESSAKQLMKMIEKEYKLLYL